MKRLLSGAILVGLAMVGAAIADEATEKDGGEMEAKSVLDFTVKQNDGADVKLGDKFSGKVLLIVNTASKCGYTPQYADLEAVYEKYREQGFEVLAFPSNDFGAQEPGSDEEIKEFCTTNYSVSFPLFSKIPVKGEAKNPLYAYLTDAESHPDTGGEIKWNFTKFLVGRDGGIIGRYESKVKPTDAEVTGTIEKALAEAAPAAKG